jgi:hypothetical protein
MKSSVDLSAIVELSVEVQLSQAMSIINALPVGRQDIRLRLQSMEYITTTTSIVVCNTDPDTICPNVDTPITAGAGLRISALDHLGGAVWRLGSWGSENEGASQSQSRENGSLEEHDGDLLDLDEM